MKKILKVLLSISLCFGLCFSMSSVFAEEVDDDVITTDELDELNTDEDDVALEDDETQEDDPTGISTYSEKVETDEDNAEPDPYVNESSEEDTNEIATYSNEDNPDLKTDNELETYAADDSDSYDVQLYAEVTDGGQKITKMVIDYGEGNTVDKVDKNTFEVSVSAEYPFTGTEVEDSLAAISGNRTIEKVETDGQKVTVYFNAGEDNGATYANVAWHNGRNYPVDLTYTIVQNKSITLTDSKGNTDSKYYAKYTSDGSFIDEEADKFDSVIKKDGVNYQFYESSGSDTLIVWFHGNGEGDIADYQRTDNNIAQVIGNRGTVAWATDEAQSIFKDAYVMSFQAPDSWFYNGRDGLDAIIYDEIQEVVKQYGISKIAVSGCSAGGYMATWMMIDYPNLFDVAMINCPGISDAIIETRAGEDGYYISDDDLAKIAESDTYIWLVQGITDFALDTGDCAVHEFNMLTGNTLEYDADTLTITASDDITVTRVTDNGYDSDYTTYETKDGKYLLSIYDTDGIFLNFEEDYNVDGEPEEVQYISHFSWIYTLRNDVVNNEGTHIWNWAADALYNSNSAGSKVLTSSEPDADVTDADVASSQVKTNDNTYIIGFVALLVVAATGLVYAGYRYRRKED